MARIKIVALLSVIIIFAIGGLLWAGMSVMERAGGMVPTGTTAREFATAAIGTQVKLIVRVEQVSGGQIGAEILNKAGEDAYVRSGSHIVVTIPASAEFLMGARSDVKPDAILQINGYLSAPGQLTPHNVVILNGFVRLQA